MSVIPLPTGNAVTVTALSRRCHREKSEVRDQKSEREKPTPTAPGVCEQVVASWNEACSPLPVVLKLSAERRRKLQARVRSDAEFPSKLLAALQKVKQTPFLCGGGERGWKANFDWFIANDTNYVAVLEGKYDSAKGGSRADSITAKNLAGLRLQ